MYRWNANATGTERIQNGNGTDTEREFTGMHAERKQNAFCQAFPDRFLLIGSVSYRLASQHCLFQEVNSISKHLAEILSYGHFQRACFEL